MKWDIDSLFDPGPFVEKEQQKILEDFNKYQRAPKVLWFDTIRFVFLGLIPFFFVYIYIWILIFTYLAGTELLAKSVAYFILILFAVFLFSLCLFLIFIYRSHRLKKLEMDMIKIECALNCGWFYDPSESQRAFSVLKMCLHYSRFPGFFNYYEAANERRNIQDRMYGHVSGIPFWMGLTERINMYHAWPHYTYGQIVIVKLPKKLKHDLRLETQTFLRPKRDRMQTESVRFNDIFRLVGRKKKEVDTMLHLMETLTPSLIVRLESLAYHRIKMKVLFHREHAIFIFPHRFLQNPYTDFRKNTQIDSRDIATLEEDLKEITELAVGMAKIIR